MKRTQPLSCVHTRVSMIINPNLVCHFGVKRFYDKLLGILNFDTVCVSLIFEYLYISVTTLSIKR